jgi:hypothetical protein
VLFGQFVLSQYSLISTAAFLHISIKTGLEPTTNHIPFPIDCAINRERDTATKQQNKHTAFQTVA